ncbi:MAG: IS1380 family transposase [Chloroflexi bacterium]|nr:IS1380 family transposase [Chloroflexota bacterium]
MKKKLPKTSPTFEIAGTDEPLIARGGLVLPYEMAKALKLPQIIDRELPSAGSGHSYASSQFTMPLILMFHGGGKKLEDLRELKGEISLRKLIDMEEMPASCTVGDWLRRMGSDGRGLSGLGKVNDHIVQKILKKDARAEYTLDHDATIIEAEKDAARYTYKKEKGYQPFLGFLSELGIILDDEFRDGNVPAGARALECLKRCDQKMPEGKRIGYYRADSASYQAEVMNYCFGDQVRKKILFTITADKDEAVKMAIKAIPAQEWQRYKDDRQIAETIHTMAKTKEAFRLIVQRWPKLQAELFDPEPYCYHAIATNREEKAAEVVALHNQRGEVENNFKELKHGFGMEWLPCGETQANAVFFRIGVIAYNLFQSMKLLILPVWWRTATIDTVRWRLYQVAGKLVYHARRIILKLAATIDKICLFQQVCGKCFQVGYG